MFKSTTFLLRLYCAGVTDFVSTDWSGQYRDCSIVREADNPQKTKPFTQTLNHCCLRLIQKQMPLFRRGIIVCRMN